jgi:superfamily II DNA or RNA helicase
VTSYNRERFEDLLAAGWDLVIVDEAHRLGGSTDQVARYKLGQGLAEAVPYLLLLSATPHQGKTDAFHRLFSLLDPEAFPDSGSVTPERVRPDEWADLDGQEQLDTLLATRLTALQNERAEVQRLLDAALRCEQAGPDAKTEALLEWIYQLQQEESDPELKILIFTEFVSTQEMLQQFLKERGFTVVCLHGSMNMDERTRVQGAFATNVRMLISTDAGGEGLNLQFCHVVINYDIPWNPMRLEQRIGRVDRIGQDHTGRAVNFVLQDSVEHRVREALEEKLAVIFAEFGIDKTGDVLDSAQAGQIFDDLYVEAILHPETLETSAESVATRFQAHVREARESVAVLGATDGPQRGATADLPSLATLGRTHDGMLLTGIRRPGPAARTRLGSDMARWRESPQCGVHCPGCYASTSSQAFDPRRPCHPWIGDAIAACRSRAAHPLYRTAQSTCRRPGFVVLMAHCALHRRLAPTTDNGSVSAR